MKVISPVIRAETQTEPVKQKKPALEVTGYLKFMYPIPVGCDKMDIRPLWDEYHYRINYWGNKKIAKKGGHLEDSYVILDSMMVFITCENGKFTSKIV